MLVVALQFVIIIILVQRLRDVERKLSELHEKTLFLHSLANVKVVDDIHTTNSFLKQRYESLRQWAQEQAAMQRKQSDLIDTQADLIEALRVCVVRHAAEFGYFPSPIGPG